MGLTMNGMEDSPMAVVVHFLVLKGSLESLVSKNSETAHRRLMV